MAMVFQEETELIVPIKVVRFKEFYGREIFQLPLLLSGRDKEGENSRVIDVPRTPITPQQLLYERLHCKNENDKNMLRANYVHTAYPVIADPEGSGAVVIGSYSEPVVREIVNSLSPKSKTSQYSIVVSNEQYEAVKSCSEKIFIPPDIANNLRKDRYSEQKTRLMFWGFITESDTKLLDGIMADVAAEKHGDLTNLMGLSLSQQKGLRLLCISAVINGDVNANDSHIFGDNNSRLIGVAPQEYAAPKPFKPSLKQILEIINNSELNKERMIDSVLQLYDCQSIV